MVDNVAPKQTLGKRPSMEDVMGLAKMKLNQLDDYTLKYLRLSL